MPRQPINDLIALRLIAEARSFTRAAAQLGVSPSALSHAIRALEERVGLRLLTRTTRRVAATEAGERLLSAITPHLDGIEAELALLGTLRNKPAGTIRITTGIDAAQSILWPALAQLLPAYPDIVVELAIDTGFVDIVAERFDVGVRIGETVGQDMIAVRIGPDIRMVAVATSAYLAARGTPATPHDLARHNCVNLRFPTHGGRSSTMVVRSTSESRVKSSSMTSHSRFRRPATGSALPICWKITSATTSTTGGWSACWGTGAHRFRAITSIIPAGANSHRRCGCSSRHCDFTREAS